jgi:hypothetical protein
LVEQQRPRQLAALTPNPAACPALHLLRPAAEEAAKVLEGAETFQPSAAPWPKDRIPCYDPSTMQLLGYAKAMTPAEVCVVLWRCRAGQPCAWWWWQRQRHSSESCGSCTGCTRSERTTSHSTPQQTRMCDM